VNHRGRDFQRRIPVTPRVALSRHSERKKVAIIQRPFFGWRRGRRQSVPVFSWGDFVFSLRFRISPISRVRERSRSPEELLLEKKKNPGFARRSFVARKSPLLGGGGRHRRPGHNGVKAFLSAPMEREGLLYPGNCPDLAELSLCQDVDGVVPRLLLIRSRSMRRLNPSR